MYVYTQTGSRLELVEPPFAQGGEGAVYRIAGHPSRVAKVYTADAAEHQGKIEAMASLANRVAALPALENVAWPMAPLYADKARRTFVGFGMRSIESQCDFRELHEYPAPAGMHVGVKDKVRLLVELAEITHTLHSLGQVIGDFNDNNIVLMKQGRRVGLVDVDSFHASIGGAQHRCVVCMSGYMAPELIRAVRGSTFKDTRNETFTVYTDRFSLAVHVFRMLFNGVHPYHCVGLPRANGSVPAPLPLEKRVERGDTPYFKHVSKVKVPPFSPDASMLPPYMRAMFERAFVAGQRDPSQRPSAKEWHDALTRYSSELKRCRRSKAHWYHEDERRCPYCEAEDAYGAGAVKATARAAGRLGQPAMPPQARAAAASAAAQPRIALFRSKAFFWIVTMLATFTLFDTVTNNLAFQSLIEDLFGASYLNTYEIPLFATTVAGAVRYNRRHADHVCWADYVKVLFAALAGLAIGFIAAPYLMMAALACIDAAGAVQGWVDDALDPILIPLADAIYDATATIPEDALPL